MASDLFLLASEAVAQRVILLLNHVLSSEPVASARLQAHAGRRVALRVRSGAPFLADLSPLVMRVTPAGLLEFDGGMTDVTADLNVMLGATDPVNGFLQLLAGQRPRMEIAGDADFAADVNWLFENLRLDLHDELARLVGDAPAHELLRIGRTGLAAMRGAAQWASRAASRGFPAGAQRRTDS